MVSMGKVLNDNFFWGSIRTVPIDNPLTMPSELRKVHIENDKAVMRAYGFSIKDLFEADCVAALMKMYQELINTKKI